jgi:hypothetical protein
MREPDFSGIAKVWQIRHQPEMKTAHADSWGYASGSLCDFIVHGPYHPLWSWWYIGLVHLRPIEGAPPANKQYPEAEYELMCLSLNPRGESGRPKIPDLEKLEAGDVEHGLPGFLTPPDWVVQFHGVTDEQARKIATIAVKIIAEGQSCDSDFRQWWKHSISETARHYREGLHE